MTNTAFHYSLYGCPIRTNIELPLLAPLEFSPGAAALMIEVEEAPGYVAPVSGDWAICLRQHGPLNSEMVASLSSRDDGLWLRLHFSYQRESVTFTIAAQGRHVRVCGTPGVHDKNLAQLVAGPVMNCVLHWQGRLSLHAALVATKRGAIALVGAQGAGKSTTAGALADVGAMVLSDDIVALDSDGISWRAHPGLPGVRLRPDSQATLRVPVPSAHPLWQPSPQMPAEARSTLNDKVVAILESPGSYTAPDRAYRLAGVYILSERQPTLQRVRVVPVAPVTAVVELAQQPPTLPQLIRPAHSARFHALSSLVRHTPVRRVERPDDLATLLQVRDAILADIDLLPVPLPGGA